MAWINVIGIALGLAMDAFAVAVAVGIGLQQVTPRHVFRVAFHFGLFQWMMPVLGYLAGTAVIGSHWLQAVDHWIAFGLLAAVGGKMLWEARGNHEAELRNDPTRGLMLVTLSLATSLDALAVGLTMAILGETVWAKAVVIGAVAAGLSALGITFGNRLGSRWEHRAEFLGGTVLILIGLRILVTHLWA